MRVAYITLLAVLLCGTAARAVELYANGVHIVSNPAVVVENGVSYGPLRAVAEAIGGKVDWQEQEQRAVVCRGTACVMIRASEGILRQNRLLLPIRRLAESLGGTVTWRGGAHPRIDLTMPPPE